MRQLCECLPEKCLRMAPGYIEPGPDKWSETFTRPGFPPPGQKEESSQQAAPAAAQPEGKPVNDSLPACIAPLCEKVSAGSHFRGSRG